MKVLVTGAAGFIGFHAINHLVGKGHFVVGLDNINDYYSVELKYDRLKEAGIMRQPIGSHEYVQSEKYQSYRFVKADLLDKNFINGLFEQERFDVVCNLAAQVGVRYSIRNPHAYADSNITGFLNILEACRYYPVKHLVFASSSSVYGLNKKIPYSESDRVDSPISLYAATKRSGELMAHVYSHLYGIPATGVRFFTVYGPWGRPDMAPFLFLDSIVKQKPIKIFNHGNLSRDFTYIDDIIGGLAAIIESSPAPDNLFRIYNIGRGQPVELLDFIAAIEEVSGKKAVRELVEMQKGDVYTTYASTEALERDFGYRPKISVREGINRLYEWYINYRNR